MELSAGSQTKQGSQAVVTRGQDHSPVKQSSEFRSIGPLPSYTDRETEARQPDVPTGEPASSDHLRRGV